MYKLCDEWNPSTGIASATSIGKKKTVTVLHYISSLLHHGKKKVGHSLKRPKRCDCREIINMGRDY